MANRFIYAILLITVIFLGGCSKPKCHYTGIPNSLFFLIKKDGNRLPDAVLDKLKLSYGTGQSKKYISDLKRAVDEAGVNAYDMGILNTRMVGFLSSEQHTKYFELEFPDSTHHQLFIDYEAPTTANGCVYVLKEVTYDGTVLNIDSSIKTQRVYLIHQ